MRKRYLALTGLAAAGLVFGTAGPSQAAPIRCINNWACYFYNSNHAGAVASVGEGALPDFDYQVFNANSGLGSGQPLKNNAASAENDTDGYFFSYYNSLWQGSYDIIPPNSWANLKATYNENASECFNSVNKKPTKAYCQASITD